jgi:hypothetical protein
MSKPRLLNLSYTSAILYCKIWRRCLRWAALRLSKRTTKLEKAEADGWSALQVYEDSRTKIETWWWWLHVSVLRIGYLQRDFELATRRCYERLCCSRNVKSTWYQMMFSNDALNPSWCHGFSKLPGQAREVWSAWWCAHLSAWTKSAHITRLDRSSSWSPHPSLSSSKIPVAEMWWLRHSQIRSGAIRALVLPFPPAMRPSVRTYNMFWFN